MTKVNLQKAALRDATENWLKYWYLSKNPAGVLTKPYEDYSHPELIIINMAANYYEDPKKLKEDALEYGIRSSDDEMDDDPLMQMIERLSSAGIEVDTTNLDF